MSDDTRRARKIATTSWFSQIIHIDIWLAYKNPRAALWREKKIVHALRSGRQFWSHFFHYFVVSLDFDLNVNGQMDTHVWLPSFIRSGSARACVCPKWKCGPGQRPVQTATEPCAITATAQLIFEGNWDKPKKKSSPFRIGNEIFFSAFAVAHFRSIVANRICYVVTSKSSGAKYLRHRTVTNETRARKQIKFICIFTCSGVSTIWPDVGRPFSTVTHSACDRGRALNALMQLIWCDHIRNE